MASGRVAVGGAGPTHAVPQGAGSGGPCWWRGGGREPRGDGGGEGGQIHRGDGGAEDEAVEADARPPPVEGVGQPGTGAFIGQDVGLGLWEGGGGVEGGPALGGGGPGGVEQHVDQGQHQGWREGRAAGRRQMAVEGAAQVDQHVGVGAPQHNQVAFPGRQLEGRAGGGASHQFNRDRGLALGGAGRDRRGPHAGPLALEVDVVEPGPVDEAAGGDVADDGVVLPAVP